MVWLAECAFIVIFEILNDLLLNGWCVHAIPFGKMPVGDAWDPTVYSGSYWL